MNEYLQTLGENAKRAAAALGRLTDGELSAILLKVADKLESSAADILAANAGDVMFIPAKAMNKELAKEFLTFLCSEEMLVEFTEFTGMMRPFEYNPLTSTYKDPAKEYSEFTQSCFNLYMNCDANLFEFPKNASLKQQQDPTFNTYIYTYKRPELFQEVTLTTAITKLKTLTGEEVMVTGGPNYESVYTRVSKEFPKWESELGLA